jgi:hypothetical protein
MIALEFAQESFERGLIVWPDRQAPTGEQPIRLTVGRYIPGALNDDDLIDHLFGMLTEHRKRSRARFISWHESPRFNEAESRLAPGSITRQLSCEVLLTAYESESQRIAEIEEGSRRLLASTGSKR